MVSGPSPDHMFDLSRMRLNTNKRLYSCLSNAGHDIQSMVLSILRINNTLQQREKRKQQKQITKNPSNESKFRGWKLLEICLKSFPPSDDLENFLDYFCRKNSRIRLTKLIYSRIYVGAEESTASAKTDVEGAEEANGVRNVRTNETIHGAVTRRLSTAGLLWKDKKKIKKKKKNAYQTTKSNKWNNNYSTLNTEKEVTEDVLLCKKRNDRVRDQPKKRLGRHTQAIMKRLGQEAKKTDVLTINLNIRKKEKEQNNKSARRRKEDLRRVLGGQSPVRRSKKYLPLNSRNADRNRKFQNTKKCSSKTLFFKKKTKNKNNFN